MDRKYSILVGLLVLVGLVVLVFYGYKMHYFSFDNSGNVVIKQNNGNTPTKFADWNTLSNQEYGFELKYPNNFFDQGHEPKILTGSCNDTVFPEHCPDISKIAQDNTDNLKVATLERWSINSVRFCSYKITDAAAGHRYYNDYYVTVRNHKCFVVELQTSESNCDNYLPLESGNTEQEKNYHDCVQKNTARPEMLKEILSTFLFR